MSAHGNGESGIGNDGMRKQPSTEADLPEPAPFRMSDVDDDADAPPTEASPDGETPTRPKRRKLLIVSGTVLLTLLLLPILVVIFFRWAPVPFSAFMLSEALFGKAENAIAYEWVSWEKIPPHMALAVVAAEDQKFPDHFHFGFDFESIADAIEDHQDGKRLRGASTITQQTAKNLFLWSGRSLIRKGLEAWFTLLLETLWPKRRILEVYLNIAEFGEGIFGVHAAADAFWGKPPDRLRPAEAALLAAVLPNPKRFHADRPSPYVRRRAAWIRRQMRQLGGVGYLDEINPATPGAEPPG